MNTSFGAILDKPASDIERPKPLPTGTYVCVVKGLPRYDKSSKKQTEFAEYTLQPLQAGDDVEEEALQEMGGIANRTIRATYYITEDALWRLKKFIEDCGVEIEDGHSLREYCEQLQGRQVLATIKHRASDDGQSVFAELAGTAQVS